MRDVRKREKRCEEVEGRQGGGMESRKKKIEVR